jgi:DNA-binding response OmpR family regulator
MSATNLFRPHPLPGNRPFGSMADAGSPLSPGTKAVALISPTAGDLPEWADALAGSEFALYRTGPSDPALRSGGEVRLALIDLAAEAGRGFSLCRQLSQTSEVPILLLGAVDPIDRILAVELGADDALDRDIHPRELLARLRAVTRSSSRPGLNASGKWRGVGSFRRMITPAGLSVEFPPAEWVVLQLMIERGEDGIGLADVRRLHACTAPQLRTCISRMRRRLAAVGEAPIINAYRGRYLFRGQVEQEAPIAEANRLAA